MTVLLALQGGCSIREYRSKELCAMHFMSALLQFEHFIDYSIIEYHSILDELSSVF